MWPVQKVKVHPTGYEWGEKGEKLEISYLLKVHRLSHHRSCGVLTWILAAHTASLPLVHWWTGMSGGCESGGGGSS